MGIFTRFRDIVNANISAMLDKAEDPEKLIRLMIQEMEETLVELKASCARTMAQAATARRHRDEAASRAAIWHDKARLAVDKGREDLAREALLEKRRMEEHALALEAETAEFEGMVQACKADIDKLEEKLASAKERRRVLVARHHRAAGKKRAGAELRRVQSADTLLRFEEFENRIERLEAEADLATPGRRDMASRQGEPVTLEEKFARLEADEDIERELAALRQKTRPEPTAAGGE
ncbi:PspA/IM30 family protein [Desulfolutivibrio sulfoxidireducens]|uniref:PspA/IM30 family protein n=1 Tax=Desulfolutivibrio sulfoxidireducens TaxID=2773299 RepID=UPI00159E026C|nr:PspA/IM30 family protein [Desulfolutivibrio sulfoxidireducens]QLA17226.1 phage shock protein A [Desulfolutivibrio sulfoxidireducens]